MANPDNNERFSKNIVGQTDPKPRSRGRPSKRAAVLDAAVAEFLAKGYGGTTLASIAQRAAVSTATVFHHFAAKADIFGAIMARVFGNDASNELPSPTAGDPHAGLLAIGRHYAASLSPPDIRSLFRVMIAEVPRFPELGVELYEKGKKPYLERLEAYLSAESDARTVAIENIPLAARQFLGMINDVVFWPHMLIIDLPDTDAEAVVSAAVTTFLRGYALARRA